MRLLNAFRRLLHNADKLPNIDQGIGNLATDQNLRLDKLIELQRAQLVLLRDLVEAVEHLTRQQHSAEAVRR